MIFHPLKRHVEVCLSVTWRFGSNPHPPPLAGNWFVDGPYLCTRLSTKTDCRYLIKNNLFHRVIIRETFTILLFSARHLSNSTKTASGNTAVSWFHRNTLFTVPSVTRVIRSRWRREQRAGGHSAGRNREYWNVGPLRRHELRLKIQNDIRICVNISVSSGVNLSEYVRQIICYLLSVTTESTNENMQCSRHTVNSNFIQTLCW